MANKTITELIDEFQEVAYNSDCSHGLTGYNTLDKETIEAIMKMPENEAREYIDKLFENIY